MSRHNSTILSVALIPIVFRALRIAVIESPVCGDDPQLKLLIKCDSYKEALFNITEDFPTI